ncbi:MAG: TonB-dependent receptor [Steroidobacteraceae bacterium]
MPASLALIGAVSAGLVPIIAQAADSPAPAAADAPAGQLEEVTVTAERRDLIGTATTASEGVVVNDELALAPAFRPAQLIETVPGLVATVHSGEGKASQYLMRGYNLDHGTDIALYVDDMPVNEPTHAHGQGYADMNFLIPELATNISYTKGTYYADEGDFASVGSVHMSLLDTLDDQVAVSAGSDGYRRLFSAGSRGVGDGNLLGALELKHYDGPWVSGDDNQVAKAVLRWSSGTPADGYSITGMFYHGTWNASTDQPERAIDAGLISRFGSLDPTDGGQAQRASLTAQLHEAVGGGELAANAYAVSNRLTLWNNFTHYLVDPVDGDQEAQHEDRATLGGDLNYTRSASLAGIDNDWLFGAHSRLDFNDVSRLPTHEREYLTQAELDAVDYPSSFIERDQVRLNSVAAYAQATTHWNALLRTVLGLREDYQYGSDTGTNAGSAQEALFEPKFTLIVSPSDRAEFYASAGRGFHSDDLRGVTQAAASGQAGAPLLASQTGEELGARLEFARNLTATLALYNLDAQSETTYDPDAGIDGAGPASRRYGFELNMTYQALRWLELYGSYSANHARFKTAFDDGTGHVGYFLPNAPFATGSFNVYVKDLASWSGGLEYRYLGSFPLSADDVIRGRGYGEWNGDVSYALSHGWSAGLGLYNVLNTHANSAEFWYVDRLQGEASAGVADEHVHPLEPFNVRVTISKRI